MSGPVHPSKAGKAPRKEQGRAPRASRNGSAWSADKPRKSTESPMGNSQDIHRTPPHSIEAEQGVLGSILIAPKDAIGECVEKINDDYFYIPAHQTIYGVLVDLWNAHKAIDLITFTQALRDRNLLDSVGGPGFVTSLVTFVPTAANVDYYLDIVRDKYILRQIIVTSTESVRRAFEEQDHVDDLLGETEKKLFSIHSDSSKHKTYTAHEATMSAFEAIENAYEHKGALLGLSTGFAELDYTINGLQKKDMVIIAGRPSMGKTALAMNIVEHVALELGKPVGVFSLEMSAQQLMQRMICRKARVNLQKVTKGLLADRDFPAITSAVSKLCDTKIFIDDSSNMDIQTLSARARRMKAEHNIQILVIDYLQLLRARGFKPNERQQEVTFISKSIKDLAKSLGIPVVIVAQLNRNPEGRSGGKPRLSDLRESGSLEQDADIVGLLHRPEIYAEDVEEKHNAAGEATLEIAKARNGPTGEVPLTFIKEFTSFEDRARYLEPPGQEEMRI